MAKFPENLPQIPAPLAVTVIILLLLGILGYTQFEIYTRVVETQPSREARYNQYLAMERWLTQTGHPVRKLFRADPALITAAPEKNVFILASVFDWTETSYEELEPWILGGGCLTLSLSPWYDEEEDENVRIFLARLNLRREDMTGTWNSDTDEEIAGEDSEITGENPAGEPVTPAEELAAEPVKGEAPDLPTLDWAVRLSFIDEIDFGEKIPEMILDDQGRIMLVTIPLGDGYVSVTGHPFFMQNHNLDLRKNAALSWSLTGARDSNNTGTLFIMNDRKAQWPLENLVKRGNLLGLGLSIPVLLIIGFWMVIPVFGRFRREDPRPGKPLGERFLAEGRFLKKHKSLDTYLHTYVQELRQKLRRQGYYDDDEQSNRITEVSGLDRQMIETVLNPKHGLPYRDFIKYRGILENLLECL